MFVANRSLARAGEASFCRARDAAGRAIGFPALKMVVGAPFPLIAVRHGSRATAAKLQSPARLVRRSAVIGSGTDAWGGGACLIFEPGRLRGRRGCRSQN